MAGAGAISFVGRIDELALLRRLLDDASSGTPRLVLLSGEAGIGKTRLVHELFGVAKGHDCLTLLGSCQEDVAIPYLPVATALRPLGEFETELVSPPSFDQTLWTNPDEHDTLRLYLGVTTALLHATQDRCVVLVVEDVHWADDATADLLVHLVTSALHEASDRRLRLLIMLTSRGDWPAGGGTGSLGRVWRHPDAVSLRLRELLPADVLTLVTSIAGAQPAPPLVEELLEATGGNPFLLRSVVSRHLSSGRLTADSGTLQLEHGGRIVAPVDLDDEIRLRLERLEPSTVGLLGEASFLGDDAPIDELRAVHRQRGGTDESLDGGLREAADARVLATDEERYSFAHPQIRHVLAHRPTERDRELLHRDIAVALIAHYGDESKGHALAIAHHLERGGQPTDPAADLEWALLAGAQAWASAAWTRAMTAYDAARGWAPEPTDDERTEWTLRSAIAAYMAHDWSSAARLREAIALAREHGDLRRWAEAVLLLARFAAEDTGGQIGQPPQTDELHELLDVLGDDEPALKVRTLATLSEACVVAMQLDRAEEYEHEAERVLAESGERDPSAILRLSLATGQRTMRQLRFDAARSQFTRASRVDDAGHQPDLMAVASTRLGIIDVATGELARAERTLQKVRADRLHSVARERQLASAVLATASAARGELAHAERLATDAISLYRLHEYVFTPGIAFPVLAGCRALRGDAVGAHQAIDEWAEVGGRGTWRHNALVDAWTRGVDGVDERVNSRPWRLPAEVEMLNLHLPCIQIELARVLDRPDDTEPALVLLEDAFDRGCTFTIGWPWSIARMLGEAWLLLEKPDEAIRWFTSAERACLRAGAHLEHARTQLGLARAYSLAGDLTGAGPHARDAAVALDGLGSLDFARQARSLYSGAGTLSPTLRPALRAILVTDLGDSTALNVRTGDEMYVRVLAEHDRIIRGRLAEHDGVEFKHTGDGLCAWFASASDAVQCALGIRDDLERLTATQPEVALAVRAGVAAGEPVDAGDDLFGLAVVVAARICSLAAPGRVYVAEEVARLTRGKPLSFHEVGSFELKGLPGTTNVLEALSL